MLSFYQSRESPDLRGLLDPLLALAQGSPELRGVNGQTLDDALLRPAMSPPCAQEPRPFNVIFETPAQAPFAEQVAANVAALDAILATYRGFIAYAQAL